MAHDSRRQTASKANLLAGNLRRLMEEYSRFARRADYRTSADRRMRAKRIARGLPLAHSTSLASFLDIIRRRELWSAERVCAARGGAVAPDAPEAIMGTADRVFLYCGPFSYPDTDCGFLFKVAVEQSLEDTAEASPFDSGGLVRIFGRPEPEESPRDFLRRHALPAPAYRDLLELDLALYFEEPSAYVRWNGDGPDPRRNGPPHLSGGDRRRWTYEVRALDRLSIFDGRLEAVFVKTGVAMFNEDVMNFLRECRRDGADVVEFHADGGSDYAALRNKCIEYLAARGIR